MTPALGFLQSVWRGESPPPRPFVPTVRLSCGFSAMSVPRHKILVSKLASPLAFSQTPELQSCTHGQMQSWSDYFPPLKPCLVISVELKIHILEWDICCRNLNVIRKTLAMSLMVWILSLLFPCGICCHLRWGDCLLFTPTTKTCHWWIQKRLAHFPKIPGLALWQQLRARWLKLESSLGFLICKMGVIVEQTLMNCCKGEMTPHI